ncbi:MAG: flagellar FliJ family protein [Proteobacteria bacterium]|nr:flagellar FliJ family protein [Pseudomonadota bacterium]
MNVRGFAALARMHRFRMDQHRRKAGEIEGMRANFQTQDAALERELARETSAVSREDLAMTNFAIYAKHLELRRATLAESIADATRALNRINGHMAIEYREAKKFELALEREGKRQKQMLAKAEQAQLDEIGLTYSRRVAV